MTEAKEYLIKKGSYFYRPNSKGYTSFKFDAGRYTKADAEKEAAIEPWHMQAIHQDDVPEETAPDKEFAKMKHSLANWRDEVGKLHSQIATKDAEIASSNAELYRLRNECSDGLDALSDIDDFWQACPYPDNRKHLSPAEQISSLDSELNKAHDDIARLKAAINWCIERDDKNGSLPEAYREKLLAAAE